MSFLKITNLRKSYGALEILKDINLEIEEGGFLVLVGPSGCGKSTLLNTIAGLEPITSGDIAINGRSVSGLHPSKRDIAMVFQSYALYPNMTVAGNIAFGMEIRGVPKEEREKAISRWPTCCRSAICSTASRASFPAASVSAWPWAGRWCAIPGLPLRRAALEPRREAARRHAHRDQAAASPHEDDHRLCDARPDEAMTLATKIAVLKDGVLQQFGTPAEIYNNPANMFVADFMGSPAMNLLKAQIETAGSQVSVTLARPNAEPLRLAVPHNGALSAYAGKEVVFGIRPEALTDPDGADRNAQFVAEGECLIEVVEPAGSDTFAVTRLGGKEIVARLRADARIAPGQTSRLAFNLDKAVFFDPQSEKRIA